MGEFTFAQDEPYAGQTGVVVAYAVRHRDGVFLFDTGFGFGNAGAVRPRPPGLAMTRASMSTL